MCVNLLGGNCTCRSVLQSSTCHCSWLQRCVWQPYCLCVCSHCVSCALLNTRDQAHARTERSVCDRNVCSHVSSEIQTEPPLRDGSSPSVSDVSPSFAPVVWHHQHAEFLREFLTLVPHGLNQTSHSLRDEELFIWCSPVDSVICVPICLHSSCESVFSGFCPVTDTTLPCKQTHNLTQRIVWSLCVILHDTEKGKEIWDTLYINKPNYNIWRC